jgi:hypothetical protein
VQQEKSQANQLEVRILRIADFGIRGEGIFSVPNVRMFLIDGPLLKKLMGDALKSVVLWHSPSGYQGQSNNISCSSLIRLGGPFNIFYGNLFKGTFTGWTGPFLA